MALFSGRDLIAITNISKNNIENIIVNLRLRKIGELRFMSDYPCTAAIPGLSYDGTIAAYRLDPRKSGDEALSDRFDGWVYPNGSRFLSRDFQQAAQIYNRGNAALTSFTVPDLTNKFFTGCGPSQPIIDPQTYISYNPLDNVPNCNHIPLKHSHNINEAGATATTAMTIKNGFQFVAGGNAGTNDKYKSYTEYGITYTLPLFHKGKNTTNSLPLPLDVKMNMSDLTAFFSSAETEGASNTSNDNPECYPNNQTLPVMIYIKNIVSVEEAEVPVQYLVNFIDTIDNRVFHHQFVNKGSPVDYSIAASLIPSHQHMQFAGWNPASVPSIAAATNIQCLYSRVKYTLTVTNRRFKNTYQTGKLQINVTSPAGITTTTNLIISGSAYENTVSFPVESESRVVIIASLLSPSSTTRFKYFQIAGDATQYQSDALTINKITSNTTILGMFGTSPSKYKWRLSFVDCNLNSQDVRQRYYDNIATYLYGNNVLKFESLPMSYIYSDAINDLVSTSVNPKYREFVELNCDLKDVDTGKITTESYGLFLICSQKYNKKPGYMTANCSSNAEFHGFKYRLYDGSYFISPKGTFTISEWEKLESDIDASQIGINNTEGADFGKVTFGYEFGPILVPLPIVSRLDNSTSKIRLKINGSRETDSIQLATAAEYEAFWGSGATFE